MTSLDTASRGRLPAGFDPRAMPVLAVDDALPAVPAERLTPEALPLMKPFARGKFNLDRACAWLGKNA